MNTENFISTFNKIFPSVAGGQDLVSIYEKAMIDAGFDFADSEGFFEGYILPEMGKLHQAFLENDKTALDIFRKAGLSEIQLKWRNFRAARLSVFQKRKIKKLTEMQILLGDAQLSLGLMREVIIRHRPELAEKYGKLEILMLDEG